jgi:hypothetical protein
MCNRRDEIGEGGFSGWKHEERRELVIRKIANKCCGAERWKMKENK